MADPQNPPPSVVSVPVDPVPQETLDRQFAVSSPKTSAWVSANAGTGKTHVLTQRVTRLLLAGVRPDRLLCLTFTKAAAAEMANRVFETLGHWAVCSEHELHKSLAEFTGEDIETPQVAPARRLFAQALEAPGGLKIQTVHAFCERLLRLFPIEAKLRPGFTVLDDSDAETLLRRALADTVNVYAHTDDIHARALNILSAQVASGDFLGYVRKVMASRATLAKSRASDLADILKRADRIAESEQSLRAAVPLSQAKNWVTALSAGSKTDVKTAAFLAPFVNSGPTEHNFSLYLRAFLKADKQPLARLATKAVQNANPAIEDELRDEQNRICAILDAIRRDTIALHTDLLHCFATDVAARYDTLKAAGGKLDYNDLISRTQGLLKTSGAAQWVLYKLDGGIDHILVDEAQDTSPEQWAIITALAEEFFAGASAFDERSSGAARTIFAVGDEKQSIYSFLGADPAKFHEMQNRFFSVATQAGSPFQSAELNLSFRSTPEVLDIVDTTFTDESIARILTPVGDVVKHEARRISAPGRIELWPLHIPAVKAAPVPWDAPMDQESTDAPHAVLAQNIAETISGWLKGGEWLHSAGRPVRPSDILILVRQRNILFEELIRELKRRNVPVAGADRLTLTDHIAVMDLIALGRFALLPEDDLTLATVLRSPFINISEEQLFTLAHDRSGSLWSALKQSADANEGIWRNVFAYLDDVRTKVDAMPPFEFYKQVLDRPVRGPNHPSDNGWQALYRRLGSDAEDPIKEFLNLSLAYEQSHVTGLQAFLGWLDSGDIELKREMDQNREEVRIMTAHGSKGLQSWIVFLPDTTGLPTARKDGGILTDEGGEVFWVDNAANDSGQTKAIRAFQAAEREAEYLRLLYVAMTRARDRLYVAGYTGARKLSDRSWYAVIETAMRKKLEEGKARTLTLSDDREIIRYDSPALADIPPPETALLDRDEGVAAVPEFLHRPADTDLSAHKTLSPSQALDEEQNGPDATLSPLTDGNEDRFLYGRIVHKLLEFLPDCAPGRRAPLAQNYLIRHYQEELDDLQRQNLIAETLRILDTPDFAPLFSLNSRAEVPIIGTLRIADSEITIAGQVDRLAVTDKDVLIIDYKTNRPPPEQVSGVHATYVTQMALYRQLLQTTFPNHTVRCVLLWTDGPRAMELPEEMLTHGLENMTKQTGQG